jgi:protein O-mannosyl-transferase
LLNRGLFFVPGSMSLFVLLNALTVSSDKTIRMVSKKRKIATSNAHVSLKPPDKQKWNHRRQYLFAGAILLFTLLLYIHSLQNGFVDWDDPDYLRDNMAVHQLGWEQLKTIFSSFYSGNYHPLTTLSYALEYSVSGYHSATLYHFNNLLLHLVNVALVFWLIRLISQNGLIAGVVAFLFGIHPMHVESVAWISERKDVLYGAFFLAGLISWCYHIREQGGRQDQKSGIALRKRKFYLLSLLFFFLSLLSKSAAVVFPVVLMLLDFIFKRTFTSKRLAEKAPFIALALLFGALAILSQGSAINRGMDLDLSPLNRFFIVNWAILRYVVMLFFPAGLSAYHPYPVLTPASQAMIIYFSVLFNLIIAGIAVYSLKYARKWIFGLLFFLVNIFLVLQILPVGGAFIAERYTYISYIGLFYMIGCQISVLVEKSKPSGPVRIALIVIFLIYLTFLSTTTHRRIKVWKESLTLFDDVVTKYPGNYLAYYLRASARQDKDVDGAISDYTQSIAMKPDNPKAYNNRGNIYSAGRRYQEALRDYNAALKYDSTLTEAFNNRGAIKAIFGDLKGALADIDQALLMRPEYRDAYRNRGLVRLQMNDRRLAREDWKRAAGMGDELSVKLLNKYPQ